MITNNKFLISPNFAPQIYSIQTDKFDESYFFGVGDNILISGNIKASSYEPVETDANILSPFVALKSKTGGTDITCAIEAVFIGRTHFCTMVHHTFGNMVIFRSRNLSSTNSNKNKPFLFEKIKNG